MKKTVLIADDSDQSRELVRIVLEQAGHSVREAANGSDALLIARAFPPDLIVLDLRMPGLDGFGVVEALRADPRLRTIPVMALTASAMSGDREKALAAGFAVFIAKPAGLKELRAEVERLLAGDTPTPARIALVRRRTRGLSRHTQLLSKAVC